MFTATIHWQCSTVNRDNVLISSVCITCIFVLISDVTEPGIFTTPTSTSTQMTASTLPVAVQLLAVTQVFYYALI